MLLLSRGEEDKRRMEIQVMGTGFEVLVKEKQISMYRDAAYGRLPNQNSTASGTSKSLCKRRGTRYWVKEPALG